jgi:hypothetical protein
LACQPKLTDTTSLGSNSLKRRLVQAEGLEPPAFWSEARRSIQLSYACMVPRGGFEPPTVCLRGNCSTTELTGHVVANIPYFFADVKIKLLTL